MDTLKGKQIMVWTFMGNARMYEALRDYGDRISQIGLFSFKVRATGEIYESGVAISDMLTYINKWPHIKWLLTVANDGANSIFRALRDNTNGAQEMFLSEIIRIMEKYPWCDGIDIDLERGDGYSTHAASTAMFQNIYNTVKNYDATKHMNICLPGMTSVNGSVGGENWCVYGDLDAYCDTASIMSYGMAWAGSAPGPVSPRSWLEGIYDYATKVMNPDKMFLGMPAYGWNWQIYDTPENLGKTYRGTSNTYYAAKLWMTGGYNFTDDAPPQPITFAPISFKYASCARNSFSTSSNGFVIRNAENHWLQISTPRRSSACFRTFVSFGYLLPTSDPVNPASAISLTHCSNVFSLPRSGMSSLVHAIGAIPSFTFFLSNIFLTSFFMMFFLCLSCFSL